MILLMLIGGCVVAFFVLKMCFFLPNKWYNDKLVNHLYAIGDSMSAMFLEQCTTGQRGQPFADQAWMFIHLHRVDGVSVEETAKEWSSIVFGAYNEAMS